MSTERKNPVLVIVTVLTAVIGMVTALYKCGTEQQNFLNAVNKTETKEEPRIDNANNPSDPASNKETTTLPPISTTKTPPQATSTNVSIIYQGDQYGCSLPITITIGGKTFQPTGNSYLAYDIPLGNQEYRIQGTINCTTLGGCNAFGNGVINVRENSTFAIRWQNTAYATCSIGLFEP